MKMIRLSLVAAVTMGWGLAQAASPQDVLFVNQATLGGMAEVAAGQLAATKATGTSVKDFASKMVSDHGPNNQQLATLAAAKKLTPPNAPDAQHQGELAALMQTPTSSFDAAYLNNQVAGHQQMKMVMQKEVQSGTDPDLKAFAKQTLPVVEMHLEMAEKLANGAAD